LDGYYKVATEGRKEGKKQYSVRKDMKEGDQEAG
jgi:hypothetical protein